METLGTVLGVLIVTCVIFGPIIYLCYNIYKSQENKPKPQQPANPNNTFSMGTNKSTPSVNVPINTSTTKKSSNNTTRAKSTRRKSSNNTAKKAYLTQTLFELYSSKFPENAIKEQRYNGQKSELVIDLWKAGIILNSAGLTELVIRKYNKYSNAFLFPAGRMMMGQRFINELLCICWYLGFDLQDEPDDYTKRQVSEAIGYDLTPNLDRLVRTPNFDNKIIKSLEIATLPGEGFDLYTFTLTVSKSSTKAFIVNTIKTVNNIAMFIDKTLRALGW